MLLDFTQPSRVARFRFFVILVDAERFDRQYMGGWNLARPRGPPPANRVRFLSRRQYCFLVHFESSARARTYAWSAELLGARSFECLIATARFLFR